MQDRSLQYLLYCWFAIHWNTVAVAPNGAMTKLTPTSITDQQIEQSFVTPAMAVCMKSMQDGRLVLVCIQTNPQPVIPPGVRDFVNDPEFKNRTAVVPVHAKLLENALPFDDTLFP